MKKWEYKILEGRPLSTELNAHGADCWEVVQVFTSKVLTEWGERITYHTILKRVKRVKRVSG